MLKTISKLEHTIENRVYQFICDSDSPLEHVKEVLFQMTKFVGQIEDQVKAMKAQQEQKPPEPVKQDQPSVSENHSE